MKPGDKYVLKDDFDTIVYVKSIQEKKEKTGTLRRIVYTFEEGDKEYALLEQFFLENYRPWSSLEKYLKEVNEEVDT
jgi:hypothetical protein